LSAVEPPRQFRFREGWAAEAADRIFTRQVDDCAIVTVPLMMKDYVEFNPDGTQIDLRFYENTEGIEVGYQEFAAMYEFVKDTLVPAFTRFFPDPGLSGPFKQNPILA